MHRRCLARTKASVALPRASATGTMGHASFHVRETTPRRSSVQSSRTATGVGRPEAPTCWRLRERPDGVGVTPSTGSSAGPEATRTGLLRGRRRRAGRSPSRRCRRTGTGACGVPSRRATTSTDAPRTVAEFAPALFSLTGTCPTTSKSLVFWPKLA